MSVLRLGPHRSHASLLLEVSTFVSSSFWAHWRPLVPTDVGPTRHWSFLDSWFGPIPIMRCFQRRFQLHPPFDEAVAV